MLKHLADAIGDFLRGFTWKDLTSMTPAATACRTDNWGSKTKSAISQLANSNRNMLQSRSPIAGISRPKLRRAKGLLALLPKQTCTAVIQIDAVKGRLIAVEADAIEMLAGGLAKPS